MDFESMVALKFLSTKKLQPSELFSEMSCFFDNPPKFVRVAGIVQSLRDARYIHRDNDFKYTITASGQEFLADYEEGVRRYRKLMGA